MANVFSFQLEESFLKGYADYLKHLRRTNPGKAYKVTISVDLIPDGIGYEVTKGPEIIVEEDESHIAKMLDRPLVKTQFRIKERVLTVAHPNWPLDVVKLRTQYEFRPGEFEVEDIQVIGETDEAADLEFNEQGERCLSLIDLA